MSPGGEAEAPARPAAAARSAALNRHARHDHGKHESGVRCSPSSRRPGGRTCASPSDLAEEVIRLEGYDNVPVKMPRAAAGRG